MLVLPAQGNESLQHSELNQIFIQHIFAHSLKNINFVQGGAPLDESRRLKRFINALGGCQRAQVDEKTHFLVTTNLKSSKYNSATGVYDIPVLERRALYDAWDKRNDAQFRFDQRHFYEQYVFKVCGLFFK